jgi:hypothetical protein
VAIVPARMCLLITDGSGDASSDLEQHLLRFSQVVQLRFLGRHWKIAEVCVCVLERGNRWEMVGSQLCTTPILHNVRSEFPQMSEVVIDQISEKGNRNCANDLGSFPHMEVRHNFTRMSEI